MRDRSRLAFMSAHDHQHDQHDHHHGHSHAALDDERRSHAAAFVNDPKRSRRLLIAFGLTLIMMIAEAIGGWLSGSLALLADAAHMLVDAAALLFAWLGALMARRPADARRSFGYARLEILVGYTNALSQLLLVAWICYEAVLRFNDPQPILSGMMLAVASVGLVVNAIVLMTLGGHDHDDLNVAAARLHVIGDLLGSVGAVGAAMLVRWMDWLWADPAISIVVSLLILNSAWRLLARCAHILLEGTPDDLEVDEIATVLRDLVDGVDDVHHLHVWQLAGGSRIATLHVRLDGSVLPDPTIVAIQSILRKRFKIGHSTVQIEGFESVEADCGDCR